MNKRAVGNLGEDAACDALRREGCEILARNFRRPTGEIDVVARDRKTIVFVEVKKRSSTRYGSPAEAVNEAKRRRIVRTAALVSGREPSGRRASALRHRRGAARRASPSSRGVRRDGRLGILIFCRPGIVRAVFMVLRISFEKSADFDADNEGISAVRMEMIGLHLFVFEGAHPCESFSVFLSPF